MRGGGGAGSIQGNLVDHTCTLSPGLTSISFSIAPPQLSAWSFQCMPILRPCQKRLFNQCLLACCLLLQLLAELAFSLHADSALCALSTSPH
jgi:hypothetical protein